MRKRLFIIYLVLTLAGCTAPVTDVASLPTPSPGLATMTPFKPQVPTATIAPTFTPIPTETSLVLDIPYSIPALRQRQYNGGEITIVNEQDDSNITAYTGFYYPSDGLNIYSRMSAPNAGGPYPVIIAIHGYSGRNEYANPNYSLREFDRFVREGYIVVHPNMRNYPPSDDGDNLYRVGMAIDILNLIETIKTQAGQPGPFEYADASRLGLWAHSMGGEIALRVLTISPDIDAALLYAPLGGDTLENSKILHGLNPHPIPDEELNTQQYLLNFISPMYYYSNINANIRLFHGSSDSVVPVTVSENTCNLLQGLSKPIECTFVPRQGHSFENPYSSTFNQETFSFYKTYLKNAQ